jgi:hypothetical protein
MEIVQTAETARSIPTTVQELVGVIAGCPNIELCWPHPEGPINCRKLCDSVTPVQNTTQSQSGIGFVACSNKKGCQDQESCALDNRCLYPG